MKSGLLISREIISWPLIVLSKYLLIVNWRGFKGNFSLEAKRNFTLKMGLWKKWLMLMWQPRALLQSNREQEGEERQLESTGATQHTHSSKACWAQLCLLQNTAVLQALSVESFSSLFIKGSCKRTLCSTINRLPEMTETLDLENMLFYYSPLLNTLLLQQSTT